MTGCIGTQRAAEQSAELRRYNEELLSIGKLHPFFHRCAGASILRGGWLHSSERVTGGGMAVGQQVFGGAEGGGGGVVRVRAGQLRVLSRSGPFVVALALHSDLVRKSLCARA